MNMFARTVRCRTVHRLERDINAWVATAQPTISC
jgi:hypothetical protein